MRPVPFAAAIIGAVCLLASTNAMAQGDRWCSQGSGADNCGFVSYEQCRANISGVGGKCMQESRAAATPVDVRDFDRPGPVHVDPVREKPHYTNQGYTKQGATKQGATKQGATKQGATKQGATFRTAATTRVSARPGARTPFPLPHQPLLSSLPDFNCEFKTNSADASVPPQSNPPRDQADPGAAGALQMKLDYERQCYRHAAMIAHDRLRNLQASVSETIKLIDGGARSAVPLPDRALLAQPAEFDCEFKTATLDNTGGAPQTSGQASSGAEGALRIKLDYERQCYQHAEMISRDRLRHLQAAAGEMLKATRRNGR
jgi:hypothetical protein